MGMIYGDKDTEVFWFCQRNHCEFWFIGGFWL